MEKRERNRSKRREQKLINKIIKSCQVIFRKQLKLSGLEDIQGRESEPWKRAGTDQLKAQAITVIDTQINDESQDKLRERVHRHVLKEEARCRGSIRELVRPYQMKRDDKYGVARISSSIR